MQIINNESEYTVLCQKILELKSSSPEEQKYLPIDLLLEQKRIFQEQNDIGRTGKWMTTFTGKRIWPHDLREQDIDIKDIAHALSMICRYGGHCKKFYSVAQHCFYVSTIIDQKYAREGLLHDGTEYILQDIVTPLKCNLKDYQQLEDKATHVINKKFNLNFDDHKCAEAVKRADSIMLITEIRDLTTYPTFNGFNIESPLPYKISEAWEPAFAEFQFLTRFKELYGDRT